MEDTAQPEASRCKALTKDGKPCKAAATEGGLCYFHANPAKAVELGQRGGRKNRQPPVSYEMTMPPLKDASSVLELVWQAIADVYSKKITPRQATSIAQLCNAVYRGHEVVNLENRIASLEKSRASERASESLQ